MIFHIFLLESNLSAGLDDDDEDDLASNDPFIVQERVFSKYAAMMYTSDNNSKTFNEFKDAKYCGSCGEKVSTDIFTGWSINSFSPGSSLYITI